MQNSEKAARNAEELARRADAAAERIAGLNRSFWLSTLTGSVTMILSVIAIAVGSYFATQRSNLGIVQTTLAAFQQGQNVWAVKPGR